jgi:hypothetical protein
LEGGDNVTRYQWFAAAVLALYGTAAWKGWEIGGAKRGYLSADARQSPGGYRSYGFWRGGK